jgi:hypothetical protein
VTTFDYAAAWRKLARPAFNELPPEVHALLARVATEAREQRQLPDLQLQWPNDGDALLHAFDALPDDVLAWAARVVYFTGHWWPANGRGVELPGRAWGNHWTFSAYADQVLRERLKLSTNPSGSGYPGLSFQVHEGAIRLCYSSRDMWTWHEVAPATPEGRKLAEELREKVRAALPGEASNKRRTSEVDAAAWRAFENLKGNHVAPGAWREWLGGVADRFMVAEGDQEPDPDAPPRDVEAEKRAAIEAERARVAKAIAKLETERDGRIWWMERGIPTDNLIYYDHKPLWCFGWRHPVGPELLARILDVISEFGQPYQIKTTDGRSLEGNIG